MCPWRALKRAPPPLLHQGRTACPLSKLGASRNPCKHRSLPRFLLSGGEECTISRILDGELVSSHRCRLERNSTGRKGERIAACRSVSQRRPGAGDNLPCRNDFARILFSTTAEFLVRSSCFEAGYNVIHRLVNVELLAAEYVDEGMSLVREGVYADVALCYDDEAADAPLARFFPRTIDERVGHCDLVHVDDVRQLV